MFTLQSGQIENALRLGGMPNLSAKEMVQGLANCQQPLEHRGPMYLTQPAVNNFPTVQPASPTPSFPTFNNIFMEVPPFQMKEWEPIPFIPMPPWEGGGGGGGHEWDCTFSDPVLRAPGGVCCGGVICETVVTEKVTTEDVDAEGDANVDGDVTCGGLTVGGDVYIDRSLHVRNQVQIDGPTIFNNEVTICGLPSRSVRLTVVTDVFWQDNTLYKTLKKIDFLGMQLSSSVSSIIAGSECEQPA